MFRRGGGVAYRDFVHTRTCGSTFHTMVGLTPGKEGVVALDQFLAKVPSVSSQYNAKFRIQSD